MGREPDYANPSQWGRRSGRCAECNFDWGESDYVTLVGQCVRNVAVFGEVLSRIDPAEPVSEGLWSANRYVWHTVDVLRFGTERLWTIGADPAYGVPAWEENAMADIRGYDRLSPVVGLIALIEAVQAWRQAAMEAPQDTATAHPEAGEIDAFDVVQRNAHEASHHLWDVERRLNGLTGPA